jgi:hypothetical protein
VGDAQDLVVLTQGPQVRAYARREPPADAGVDLVKDERGDRLLGSEGAAQREEDPGCLTS